MVAVAVVVLGARPRLDLAKTRHAVVLRQVDACLWRDERRRCVQVVVRADVLLGQLVANACRVAEYCIAASSYRKVLLRALRVKGSLVLDVARCFEHLIRPEGVGCAGHLVVASCDGLLLPG